MKNHWSYITFQTRLPFTTSQTTHALINAVLTPSLFLEKKLVVHFSRLDIQRNKHFKTQTLLHFYGNVHRYVHNISRQ